MQWKFSVNIRIFHCTFLTGSWSIYCRPGPCYRIRYTITRNRWCDNVKRAHKSNGIAIEVDLTFLVLTQVCFDHDCKGYRSEPIALPFNCRSVQVDRSPKAANSDRSLTAASNSRSTSERQHNSTNMVQAPKLNSMEGPRSLDTNIALPCCGYQSTPEGQRSTEINPVKTGTLSDSGYAQQENVLPMNEYTVTGNHAYLDSTVLSLHEFCERILTHRLTS